MKQDQSESLSNQSNGRNAIKIFIPLIIFLLIITNTWLLYRVDRLEKSLISQQSQIATIEGQLSAIKSNIVSQQSQLASILGELNGIEGNITTLAAGLDYVTPLAENANFYAHSHYSDSRLKTDVTDISNPIGSVLALHGVRFRWNTKDFPEMFFSDKPQIGLIAQEVEMIIPELVMIAPNGYKMIDYAKLTPILVEAIKDQQVMINLLQRRVSSIEIQP